MIAVLTAGYLLVNRPLPGRVDPVIRSSIPPPAGNAFEAAASRQTFALSPDGTRLAFAAMDASGVFQVFLRDLDSLESKPEAAVPRMLQLMSDPKTTRWCGPSLRMSCSLPLGCTPKSELP